MSLIANFNWPLHQLDVKNVFLNREVEEKVIMHLPPGFDQLLGHSKVLKLKKSLHDLKHSSWTWFKHFTNVVKGYSYFQIQADHTLLYKRSRNNKISILIVYVYDIIITCDDFEGMTDLKKWLSRDFEIKDLGEIKYFLGTEFARSREGILSIHENTFLIYSKRQKY